jgi:RNA polymerase sigma-70 factor (ECF subfamily)
MATTDPDPDRLRLLLARIAQGDAEAFAELFDHASPRVLGLLIQMLGDRGEAEEVLQEVFLQLWRQPGAYDPRRGSARGYLLLLARSRALDRLRSHRARLDRERTVHEEQTRRSGVTAAVGTARLEEEERARAVHSALQDLPAEQRRALELAFFQGLTQAEIARRLAAPLGTIKSRVLLGMRKLRQVLEARGAEV